MKAELQSMLLDLEGPVNLKDSPPRFGLITTKWCSHGISTWADVDGDGIADLLCDSIKGDHYALLLDGRGGIKKNVGLHQSNWCVDG